MSDLKSTSVYRGLPSPDSPDFNKAVKEIIEQLVGQRGNVLDRAATLRDLASPALVGYLNDQSVSVTVSGTSPFNDSTVPPPPLDLELITDSDGDRLNAFNNMLVWTAQDSDIISHFEVWIAESASRSSAILTGIVTYPESTYTHANTDPTKTYWYWVRSISRSGIASTWEPNDPINGYVVVSDRITKETLDRVMNSLKGESPAAYSAGKTYDPGERCSYSCADGKTRVYTAVVETTGNAPASGIPPVTNSTYWERTGILLSGEVGGENVVGIDGNMVVDGTIITRNLDAGVVTTDKIAVGAVNWETQITNIPSALFQTFYSSSAPETGMSTGDYWVDSDDNSVYRYDGDSWESIQDSGIAEALQAAGDAQATADGKILTYAQATIPTSEAIGDLWIDTDDNNKLYRAESVGADQITAGEWVIVRDTGIAQALADASDAQATADGKVTTFFQDNTPTAEGTGDLWIDTNDSNKLYRWSGEAWVAVRDTGIAAALADAATAQATADGKIISTYQPTAPVAEAVGDLWFDTDDDNQPYRCEDPTMDDETGVSFGPEYNTFSFVSGNAFYKAHGLDLGRYVGRQITVSDSSGKKAVGWISEPGSCGDELVTNGTFDSNVDDWAGYTDYDYETCEWQDGKMHCVNTSGSGYRSSNVSFQLTAGKRYLVSFDIDLISGALPLWCLANSAAGALMILSYLTCADGHNTFQVDATATSGAGKFFFYNTTAADFTIDNVSVREMTDSNLLLNPSFETAGGGGADVFGTWVENTSAGGSIADEGSLVQYGSHAAKLSCAGAGEYAHVSQWIATVPGTKYRLGFYTRGDGTSAGRYIIYDSEHSYYIASFVSTGVTGTQYTYVSVDFLATGTGVYIYFCSPLEASGIAYFDDVSLVALETLGTELVTNGDNEAAAATFEESSTAYGTTTQSSDVAKFGTYSTKVTLSGEAYYGYRIYADTNLSLIVPGKCYKVSCWVYLPSGQAADELRLQTYGDPQAQIIATTATDTWVQLTSYITPWNQFYVYILGIDNQQVNNTSYFYIDDISIKEVTDVDTEGAHIVSEYSGSTQSWESIDSLMVYTGDQEIDVFPLWLPVGNPVADWSKVYGDGKPSDNATSDLSLVVTTGCTLIGGNGATKSSGSSSWDTSVYSRDGYTGGAFCSAMAAATNHYIMFGLDTNPTENNSYTHLDYAWYFSADASCQIYEGGSPISSHGTYTVNTVLSIAYDGSNIRYMKDGVVVRTVAVSPNLVFFFDSSFHDVGATITNIRFSPLSSRNTVTESVSGSAPSNPVSGDLWYQTDTKLLKKYTGATWNSVGNSFDTCDDLGDGAVYGKMPKNWKHASDATYIDGGKVYTGTIVASAISTTSLSALSANLGTVTAGLAKSSDGKIQVDFDNKWIKVWDASSTLRVHLGYIP